MVKIALLLAVALVAGPAEVKAQPQPAAQDNNTAARKAFNEGDAAYNLGRFEEALHKYEEAYRLSHLAPILFNLGQAHRRLYEERGGIEHLQKAREFYRAYLREVPISPQGRTVQELLREVEEKYAGEIHRQRERLLVSATGKQALDLAQDFCDQDNYPDAVFALNKFFHTPGNSRQDLVHGYVLAARVAIAQHDEDKARESLARALVLDPAVAPPPSLGPELGRAFEQARRRVEGRQPLTIRHTARGEVQPGQTPVIRVDIVSDPLSMIHSVVLNFRAGGSKAWSQVESREGGTLMLPKTVASGLHSGSRLEYYIEAVDEGGGVVQSLGTAEGPFALTVREERPWYRNWLLWSAVGVVAIGTTVAIAAAHEGPFDSGPQVPIGSAPH
jgi:tetratricopeptide (TPR) repeat protein